MDMANSLWDQESLAGTRVDVSVKDGGFVR